MVRLCELRSNVYRVIACADRGVPFIEAISISFYKLCSRSAPFLFLSTRESEKGHRKLLKLVYWRRESVVLSNVDNIYSLHDK